MAKNTKTNIENDLSDPAQLHAEILQIAQENNDIIEHADDCGERWEAAFPDGMLEDLCMEFRCCPSLIFIVLESIISPECPDIHSRSVAIIDENNMEVRRFSSVSEASSFARESGLSDKAMPQTLWRSIIKRNGNIYGKHWATINNIVCLLERIKHRLVSYSGIYMIRNIITGQEYIGQTKNKFYERWQRYIRDSKTQNRKAPYQSFNEYGIENFHFMIIEIIPHSSEKDIFCRREKYWIDFYQTLTHFGGFNYVRPTWQKKLMNMMSS